MPKTNEEAFQMLEERAQRADSGAIRKVLRKTAMQKLPPLHSEDQLPDDFDRHTLERRVVRETRLHNNRAGKIDSED